VTLLESMACGTPMLVSDITGFHELIAGGKEAELIPPDRPTTWAEAVISLLGDPSRRKIMSKAGCEKARAFSWNEVATRVMQVYERAAR
jgi:glycosyltransferase involved in cell wall biosynthesis